MRCLGPRIESSCATVFLTVLQTALVAGLLVHYVLRRRAEREIRGRHWLLQASHDRISELLGRLIAAHDRERARIAGDLHDRVGQRVAALSIAISSLKRKLAAPIDPESAILALNAIQRDTIALAEEVRRISNDLHPSLLEDTGLVSALDGLCATFGKQQAITVTCGAVPDFGPLDCETAMCLYRVTQEALHNAGKHAKARRVDVRLTRTADGILLSIADDGKGFDLATARERVTGLGLVSIEERVRQFRGRVDIETKSGAGTLVLVRIPSPA